jgi:hypothetical protein
MFDDKVPSRSAIASELNNVRASVAWGGTRSSTLQTVIATSPSEQNRVYKIAAY